MQIVSHNQAGYPIKTQHPIEIDGLPVDTY